MKVKIRSHLEGPLTIQDEASFQALEPRIFLSAPKPLRSAMQLHVNTAFAIDGGEISTHPPLSPVAYFYLDLPSPKHVIINAYGSKDYDHDLPDPILELIQDKNANSAVDKGEVLVVANNEISIAKTLGAGRWFFRASLPAGADYTPFEVRTSTSDPIEPPTTFRKSVFWSASQSVSAAATTPLSADYYNTLDATDNHYYAVKFNHRAGLRAYLDLMYANVDLQLIKDVNGNGKLDQSDILISSNRTRNKTDYVNTVLDPGTYLLRVFSTGVISPYHLQLSAVTAPAVDPGSSMATAFDLGSFDHGAHQPQMYMSSMSPSNRRDYYKITATDLDGAIVTLNSLEGDVDIQVIHDTNGNGLPDDGETVASSSNPGLATDYLYFTNPGTYFIRIYRASDGAATYQMKIE